MVSADSWGLFKHYLAVSHMRIERQRVLTQPSFIQTYYRLSEAWSRWAKRRVSPIQATPYSTSGSGRLLPSTTQTVLHLEAHAAVENVQTCFNVLILREHVAEAPLSLFAWHQLVEQH